MGRRHVLVLVAMVLLEVTLGSGCSPLLSRAHKVLVSPEFVYDPGVVASPTLVTFKTGYRGELPRVYPFEDAGLEQRKLFRPPTVTRDGWIEITPQSRSVQMRVYVRAVGQDEGPFLEIKSITGDIPGHTPSELRFLDNVSTSVHPQRILLRNLNNPYNGYTLRDGALILVEIIDPDTRDTWRYLFVYRDFGSRQKLSFNIVFNVPLNFLATMGVQNLGTGVGNTALTMSYSIGYRFRTQNRMLRWVGDKTALVVLVGTSDSPFFGRQLFNNLSLGAGLEFYDFFSANILMDTHAIGEWSTGSWGVVVGFDAVRFADFSRNLTTKLLRRNPLR